MYGLARYGAVALVPLALACGSGSHSVGEPAPPGARPELVEALRADLEAKRDPSDGGGRATLVSGSSVAAGGVGRWEFLYEAGELGIAEGGMLFLQVSPFWGWSTPQTEDPQAWGYTEVSTDAAGVLLEPETVDRQLLGIEIRGRALVAGERIRIVYGAGDLGALADRYAERGSRFWFAVDGDGDGVRGLVPDPPEVDIVAGRAALLVLHLPSTARPDEAVTLHVAVLDRNGSRGVDFEGVLHLETSASGVELASELGFAVSDRGIASLELIPREEGVVRLTATGPDGLEAISNPLLVSATAPRLLWADLHGHSGLSDGTGTAEDYLDYARYVAALDVIALTDHDHWGMEPLALHPEIWRRIRDATAGANEPGSFVALLGYEWTNWIHGHRHVLYFADQGEVLDSLDPDYDDPRELWDALRGLPALTFAHHSAGGPIATDWSIPPDPELEPVTEIVSVHGSSEAGDSPMPIYRPLPGNWVRDALGRGYRLGFVGSGDSHDGHPGLSQIAGGNGGLAALFSEERTREGVREALLEHRCYATNGPRILLQSSLGGRRMGSTVPPSASAELAILALGTAPIDTVDVVRSGQLVLQLAAGGALEVRHTETLSELATGEYVYVRVVQSDGGAAWSSPFYVQPDPLDAQGLYDRPGNGAQGGES